MKYRHTFLTFGSLFCLLVCSGVFCTNAALAGYDVATRSFGPFSQLSASTDLAQRPAQTLAPHAVFVTPWQQVPEFHSLYIVWSHIQAYGSADDLAFFIEQEDGNLSRLDFASDGKSLADASVAVGSYHAPQGQKYRLVIHNMTSRSLLFPTFEITTIKSSAPVSAATTLLAKIAYTGKQITDMILSAPQEMTAGSDLSFVQSRAAWGADESLRTTE